jgi:hypothetical protein
MLRWPNSRLCPFPKEELELLFAVYSIKQTPPELAYAAGRGHRKKISGLIKNPACSAYSQPLQLLTTCGGTECMRSHVYTIKPPTSSLFFDALLSFHSDTLNLYTELLLSPQLLKQYPFVFISISTLATMSLFPLGAALVLLMIDSAIELALISSMVGYLHRSGANQYPFISDSGSAAFINAKPKGLLLNEGHTSNGASGTALILVCFGGFLVLWHEQRRERKVIPFLDTQKEPEG